MMKEYAPLIREFSAIRQLQAPYRLVYSLDAVLPGGACRLSLRRSGVAPCCDSMVLDGSPRCCYDFLRYLYENAVQPELWRDIAAELYPAAVQEKGRNEVTFER